MACLVEGLCFVLFFSSFTSRRCLDVHVAPRSDVRRCKVDEEGDGGEGRAVGGVLLKTCTRVHVIVNNV